MDCPTTNAISYSIEADLLYWKAEENGTQYAIFSKPSDEKVKSPDFHYHFGFRISFAYLLKEDLKLDFCFTHFHARTNTHLHAEEQEVIFPVWSHPSISKEGFVNEVESRWRLHLGFGDVNAYKCAFAGDAFSFSPHLGLRYAEVRQKSRVDYRGGSLFPDSQDDLSMKNKFWGLGPRIGLNGQWNLFNEVCLYGDAALAFLYGRFYVHQDEEVKEDPEVNLKILNIFTLPQLIVDMQLGLSYSYTFPKKDLVMHFKAGWEMDYLFGQNQLIHFLNATEPAILTSQLGDLTLSGWTFSFQIDF